MTRVPDHVVEKMAQEFTEMLSDPKYMCLSRSVPDAVRTIGEITGWAEDFETFTHESFRLYPGWNQENFALFVHLIPTAHQIEKQHEGVFCKSCSSRCLDVSPKVMEEAAERRGFRTAIDYLDEKAPRTRQEDCEVILSAVRDLEDEAERLFGVDWNKDEKLSESELEKAARETVSRFIRIDGSCGNGSLWSCRACGTCDGHNDGCPIAMLGRALNIGIVDGIVTDVGHPYAQ